MTYRNEPLLRLAEKAPHCMAPGCYRPNQGQIVAAHSNQIRDGKGTGHKAHDFRCAFICDLCHFQVDQGPASRADRQALWEGAHRATIGWLFNAGFLRVVTSDMPDAPPAPIKPKPKKKLPSGRALPQGRKLQGGRKLQSRNTFNKRPFGS